MYSGSDDFKDVGLFNGDRNLRLEVYEEEAKYRVRVAKRPLVSIRNVSNGYPRIQSLNKKFPMPP